MSFRFLWKSLFSLTLLFSMFCWADYYIAPTIGYMSVEQTSGESGGDPTYGFEGLYLYGHWLAGLKYDHWSSEENGNSLVSVSGSKNILAAEGGWRLSNSSFSPYVFVGMGSYFQSVTTKLMGDVSNDYAADMVYKLGLGLLGRFSDNFALGAGIHYYPQAFVNSVDFVFSGGYYF